MKTKDKARDGGWSVDQLAQESSLKTHDEIARETRRGNESDGNADERDAAGAPDSNETAHGREEAKNDVGGKANANG